MKLALQKTEASFKQCREIFFEFATFIFFAATISRYIYENYQIVKLQVETGFV